MPSQVPLPPWLQADVNAPVGRMLEGYGLGLRASEAQQANAARAQQQMLAQQQAAELNAYRQQQQALDAQQFNERMRLDQEKAQREAAAAASQLEGMNQAERLRAQGMDWPQILAQVGPKLFPNDPRGFVNAMEQVAGPRPPVFGQTPEGAPYMQSPTGGATLIPPSYLRGARVPEPIFGTGPGGTPYVQNPITGSVSAFRQPQEGAVTQAGRARLAELGRDETRLYKTFEGLSEDELAEESPETAQKIQDIDAERQLIYSGQWKPGQPAAQAQATVDPQEMLRLANEKIERIRKGIPAGPAQEAAINQVIAKLRSLGVNVSAGTNAPAAPPTRRTNNVLPPWI